MWLEILNVIPFIFLSFFISPQVILWRVNVQSYPNVLNSNRIKAGISVIKKEVFVTRKLFSSFANDDIMLERKYFNHIFALLNENMLHNVFFYPNPHYKFIVIN